MFNWRYKWRREAAAFEDRWSDEGQAYMEAMSAELLKEAGLEMDDSEYNELVEDYGGKISDPDQWVRIVEVHCRRRKNAD